jgi:hypothetical protein
MKKSVMILYALVLFSFLASAACNLDATLINQDPYPAVPGDYVKLIFQVTGINNPECGTVSIELLEKYPISFDPEDSPIVRASGGVYERDYSSYLVAPYKVRVDKDALNGENKIEVKYGTGDLVGSYLLKSFNLEVENTYADFEIYVKDYDSKTNTITFEILNIAKADVEALTLEIPKQENIQILGSKIEIVGDLDSNEYTTADFTAIPKQGEIKIKISYSDSINERRILEKNVVFDPEYFLSSEDKTKRAWYVYLIYAIVIGAVVYYFYIRRKKKKESNHRRRGNARL